MATKKQKPITDEIATVRNDIIQDYLGNVVLNPDKILKSESGGKGIELYEDLMRDSEVESASQTRTLAVTGKEWGIDAASDDAEDVKKAEYVEKVFKAINYDAAREALLSGNILGFKPAEVMWEYSEGDVWIKEIIGKASRRFVFDLQGRLRLLTMQNMIEGVEVPDRKFVVFRNVSDNGSYYGDGLGRSLYWPVWFRKNGIKFWAIFCDKFGSPTPVGKYPPGTPKPKQDDLLAAITAIQQESGVVIPENMIIDLLEAQRAGSIDAYDSFCAYQDKAINKVLLGHSAATESTPGKLGNEQQSVDIRQDYIKADADALCECQNNSLIRWIVDYNFPVGTPGSVSSRAYPKVWIRTELEKDLKPKADIDIALVTQLRLKVGTKYFYETYGIPQPGEGEELVEIPATPPPFSPSEGGQMSPAGGGAGGGNAGGGRQYAENQKTHPTDKLSGRMHDAISLEPLIEPIKKLMEESATLQEFRDGVLSMYPKLDSKEIAGIIRNALLVGELGGRYET